MKTMKTQHTPGPWVANEDGLVYSTHKKLGRRNVICAVRTTDAQLIAAAPDLLAAIKAMMVTESELRDVNCTVMQNAIAAIAKAGGGK